MPGIDPFFEFVPDDDRDIFGRRIQIGKFRHVKVQVLVVKSGLDFLFNQSGQMLDVDHISGFGINLARHTDCQLIVVTVKIGVVALAKNRFVFFERPVLSIQAVRSVKMRLSADGDFTHNLDRKSVV